MTPPISKKRRVIKKTKHTLKDLNKVGRDYKSAVAKFKYIKNRNSIERAENAEVEKLASKVNLLLDLAESIHAEYFGQEGIDKVYAEKHLKAIQNVKV